MLWHQSQLFSKTARTVPREEKSINAQLLIRGAFVDKVMAGVYSILPLGWRVLKKIEQIIREEMYTVGGQELYLPTMHPRANWEQTGRFSVEKPFYLEEQDVVLGPTHEEIIAPLAARFIHSYRDLPRAVFQIQNKFRNELRAKSGLLRGREFIMKDLYSFHTTEGDLDEYYERVKAAYQRIFQRAGIGEHTYCTFASGGSFSRYSHEFQTTTAAGEDTIHICTGCRLAINQEIKEETPQCPECGGSDFTTSTAIEVGNIFKLKTKYSEPFQLKYATPEGAEALVIMGCYGIGLQRLMGTIVEVLHDERGIRWPLAVAPFHVHLVGLQLDQPELHAKALTIAQDLSQRGIEVLYDDRVDVSAGEKFADADLLGIPFRLVMSAKTADKIEYRERGSEETLMLEFPQVVERVHAAIRQLSA